VDLAKPDFAKYPKARAATLLKCDLAAGDVLYMPPEYWHQAGLSEGKRETPHTLQQTLMTQEGWRERHTLFFKQTLMTHSVFSLYPLKRDGERHADSSSNNR
jgi:hypothetical protein